jgi:hypothetical protein
MKNSKTITIIAVIAIVTATLTIAVNFRSSSVDMSCTGNKETAERIASESGAKLGYVGTYSLENIATTGRDSYKTSCETDVTFSGQDGVKLHGRMPYNISITDDKKVYVRTPGFLWDEKVIELNRMLRGLAPPATPAPPVSEEPSGLGKGDAFEGHE